MNQRPKSLSVRGWLAALAGACAPQPAHVDTAGWVEIAALALVKEHDLDRIEAGLLAQGCPAPLADRLLAFLPSAFAAERYAPEGITFDDTFLVGDTGREQRRRYADEPVYAEARKLARRWLAEGRPSLVARVVEWSAEANAIEGARARGLTPTWSGPAHHALRLEGGDRPPGAPGR